MQTCPTQPEILLGKGVPHEIGKFSFGQTRVKYHSLSSVAFHCLILLSSLLSLFPTTPPRYSNGKAFFQRYLHKEGIRQQMRFLLIQSILVRSDLSPELS